MRAAQNSSAMLEFGRHRRFSRRLTAVVAIIASVNGCVTTGNQPSSLATADAPQSPCEAANSKYYGAVIGAVAAGTLGYFLGNKKALPAALGALGGGLVGYLIGQEVDDRRCEQWKIAQAANVTAHFDDVVVPVTSQQGHEENVRVGQISTWEGAGHFESGSAVLTPAAQGYFHAVAETYTRQPPPDPSISAQDRQQLEAKRQARRILLIGHTDDTGSSATNAKLSEARAKSVGEVFQAAGINPSQLFFQGAGETLPVADNRTEDGRAKNRRVEIVEMENEAALANYLRSRTPKTEFYRVVEPSSTAQVEKAAPPAKIAHKPSKPATASKETVEARPETTETAQAERTTSSTRPMTVPDVVEQQVKPRPYEIDFGGVPASQVTGVSSEMIGGQKQSTAQSLARYVGISSAFANDSVFQSSCRQDRPRFGGEVKRLSDGKDFEYRNRDFLPGLYRTSYAGMVNGHLLGMSDVAVLRDGAKPVGKSPLLVFKNYGGVADNNRAKPDVQLTTDINVYPGNEALLYRAFVTQDKAPVQCVDLVFPYREPFGARYGKVYYEKRGQTYAADFNPTVTR